MRDNFKNTLAQFVRSELLQKVGDGTEYGKKFLKYQVKERELWDKLAKYYLVSRKSCMQV